MRTTPAQAYNYDAFEPGPYIATDCDGPPPGSNLGDVEVERLDGTTTTLAAVAGHTLVLETGSTTCPLYRGNVARMRRIAERHPDATFALLYTREAHPGERRGRHRDMDDKRAAAAGVAKAAAEWRTILIDDIDGTLHRRLEGAPNSVTVLDASGTVLAYFHDSDPRAVSRFLEGRHAAPIRARFRPAPPVATARALLTGGWQAVRDFVRGLPALARYRITGGPAC